MLCVDGHRGVKERGPHNLHHGKSKGNISSVSIYFINTYLPVSGTFQKISSDDNRNVVILIL